MKEIEDKTGHGSIIKRGTILFSVLLFQLLPVAGYAHASDTGLNSQFKFQHIQYDDSNTMEVGPDDNEGGLYQDYPDSYPQDNGYNASSVVPEPMPDDADYYDYYDENRPEYNGQVEENIPGPDGPLVDEPYPLVDKPYPLVERPEPLVRQPAPLVEQSNPLVDQNPPLVNQPQPLVMQPAPLVRQPQPLVNQPAPLVRQPSPLVNQPQPLVRQPAPLVNQPAPLVRQ